MNEKLKIIKGRSLWSEAEYLLAQGRAYRDAAIAAEVIDEIETANAWRNRSVELETQASHLFTEAKTLGVFNPLTAISAAPLPSREESVVERAVRS